MRTISCPHCKQLIDTTGVTSDVADFHDKFELSYLGPPRFLPREMSDFRIETMQEELDEYKEAVEQQDPVKQFDALLDLLYFVIGTLLLHGFPIVRGWAMVHFANMCKVRAKSEDESKRGSTFDVIKPPGWVHPDLSSLVWPLERQMTEQEMKEITK